MEGSISTASGVSSESGSGECSTQLSMQPDTPLEEYPSNLCKACMEAATIINPSDKYRCLVEMVSGVIVCMNIEMEEIQRKSEEVSRNIVNEAMKLPSRFDQRVDMRKATEERYTPLVKEHERIRNEAVTLREWVMKYVPNR